MTVAVVTAALNESNSITRLLDALSRQSRKPDLFVIADGGSTDGTIQKVVSLSPALPFPVRVLSVPGKIAKGRNAAISQIRADIIAVTDADCVPVNDWLEALTSPIERDGVDAVAGGYYADASTPIERAIATFTWVPLSSRSKRFLPSHRSVAYLRRVWQAIGGYNEDIDSGEDTLFDLEIEKRFPFALAPGALVAWRPRKTIKKAAWQQLFYGAGDGQARTQLSYHGLIAAFVGAEVLTLFGNLPLRLVGATAIATAIAYFCWKHVRLFGTLTPDMLYVAVLTLALPPSRLLGFCIGLFGGSVRGIVNRS